MEFWGNVAKKQLRTVLERTCILSHDAKKVRKSEGIDWRMANSSVSEGKRESELSTCVLVVV